MGDKDQSCSMPHFPNFKYVFSRWRLVKTFFHWNLVLFTPLCVPFTWILQNSTEGTSSSPRGVLVASKDLFFGKRPLSCLVLIPQLNQKLLWPLQNHTLSSACMKSTHYPGWAQSHFCSEAKQQQLSELDETKAGWKVSSLTSFTYLLGLSKNQMPLN